MAAWKQRCATSTEPAVQSRWSRYLIAQKRCKRLNEMLREDVALEKAATDKKKKEKEKAESSESESSDEEGTAKRTKAKRTPVDLATSTSPSPFSMTFS